MSLVVCNLSRKCLGFLFIFVLFVLFLVVTLSVFPGHPGTAVYYLLSIFKNSAIISSNISSTSFFFCFSSVILIMLLLLRLWKSPHSSWMFSFCCFFFNVFFSFYFVLWSLNCPIIKLANPPLTHLCLLMSPLKAFLIYVALFLISSISWTLRTSVPLLTLPSTLACSWRFTLKSVTY